MTTRFGFHDARFIVLASVLLLSTTAVAQKVEPSPENISKGEAIYKKHCLMCHGATGMSPCRTGAGIVFVPRPAHSQMTSPVFRS